MPVLKGAAKCDYIYVPIFMYVPKGGGITGLVVRTDSCREKAMLGKSASFTNTEARGKGGVVPVWRYGLQNRLSDIQLVIIFKKIFI